MEQIPKEKLEKSRKYRLIEKEVIKRNNKYTEARLKATKVWGGSGQNMIRMLQRR